MAYDEALAARVREKLDGEPGVKEKSAFGSRAFVLDGNMAVAVKNDELMVRVGADGVDAAIERPHARIAVMGETKVMHGWVLVAPEGLNDDAGLAEWIERGIVHTRTLPPKG